MSASFVICSNCSVSRQQIQQALPRDVYGETVISHDVAGCQRHVQLNETIAVFMDLDAQEMDGIEALKVIANQAHPLLVALTSRYVSERYRYHVMDSGASAVLQKQSEMESIQDLLYFYGLHHSPRYNQARSAQDEIHYDAIRAAFDAATGKAAKTISELLGSRVYTAPSRVSMLSPAELKIALSVVDDHDNWSATAQGVQGNGVRAESIALFRNDQLGSMTLSSGENTLAGAQSSCEALMDMACILVGALSNSLNEITRTQLMPANPMVLGQAIPMGEIISRNSDRWRRMLAVELRFEFDNPAIQCDLLLMVTPDSIRHLQSQTQQ